jgi:hypothetical protein
MPALIMRFRQWTDNSSNELGRGEGSAGVPQLGFIKLNFRVHPFLVIILSVPQTSARCAHCDMKHELLHH